MKPKIGVVLSGCGVYDGAEIHESVFALLALARAGAEPVCFAPDVEQRHVVNHLTGEEMPEKRNVLVEAARIARGKIRPLSEAKASELDGLFLPGGFGAAKNLTSWAFDGPNGTIEAEVLRVIREFVAAGKPIGAICMGPAVVAKALQGTPTAATLTVGSTQAPSPYDIAAVNAGLQAAGAVPANQAGVVVDEKNKIVSAPCYMQEVELPQLYDEIERTVGRMMQMLT
ncbi:MAG: isoprenoid biosynthesis glyoxalase ElbB [Bacteroidia bacterium]|nr:isoprenoid biosynthesis glyoxalase ElbB [Bacteroidia bacterium]